MYYSVSFTIFLRFVLKINSKNHKTFERNAKRNSRHVQVMNHIDHLSSLEYDPAVTLALTILKGEKFTISSCTIGWP